MDKIVLTQIKAFDNGRNTCDSFAVVSHHHNKQDVMRLIGDLLLATRDHTGVDDGVKFDELEDLVNEAAGWAVGRIKEIAEQLGVKEDADRGLNWSVWDDQDPDMRHPTSEEVIGFEGESRILWDGLPRGNEQANRNRRLLAAWGCFCIERAMTCMKSGNVPDAIGFYASAGVLLSSSNYYIGCIAVDELGRAERLRASSKGGSKAAAHWKAVANEAVRIARARGLADGSYSADYIAGEIKDEVRAFARHNGRDFPGDPTRKVAAYLRKAGIKKSR